MRNPSAGLTLSTQYCMEMPVKTTRMSSVTTTKEQNSLTFSQRLPLQNMVTAL
jgi:hypothetical protein